MRGCHRVDRFGDVLDTVTDFVDAIFKAKPSGAKGTYMTRASLSSTMGPGLKLNVSELSNN